MTKKPQESSSSNASYKSWVDEDRELPLPPSREGEGRALAEVGGGGTPTTSQENPLLHSFYTPHDRVTIDCGISGGEGAKQSFKDECDINTILAGYARTGQLEHLNPAIPSFQDLPDQMDFQTALEIVADSEQAFGYLPSPLRDHYQNDPGKFLYALHDPKEKPKLTEWGIFREPIGSARSDGPTPAAGASPSPAAKPEKTP